MLRAPRCLIHRTSRSSSSFSQQLVRCHLFFWLAIQNANIISGIRINQGIVIPPTNMARINTITKPMIIYRQPRPNVSMYTVSLQEDWMGVLLVYKGDAQIYVNDFAEWTRTGVHGNTTNRPSYGRAVVASNKLITQSQVTQIN